MSSKPEYTAHDMADAAAGGWRDGVRYMVESGAVVVPAGYVLVPVEPTPEMVSAAEEAHMPFGDMDIALRMAILSAPDAAPAVQQVECQECDQLRALLAQRERGGEV